MSLINSNESKWVQSSLLEFKWAENQNGPKYASMSSKDSKYIQSDLIWAQNGPIWAQIR